MKPIRARNIGLLAILASLVMLACWFTAFRSRAPLPAYGGKSVREWFFGEDGHPGREKTMNAADLVFDAMGTNCIPFLLNEVRRKESGFNKVYGWFYSMFPSILQSKLRPPLSPYYTQRIALSHLQHMLRKLDYVASDLMAIVPGIADDITREQAYDTVEILAVRLDDVERKKTYFVAFLRDADFHIQLKSAVMLSRVDSSVTNGIPILINAVTNKSLMNSTFPTRGPGWIPNQALMRQKMAYESLRKVAPLLADHYHIAE